MDLFKDCPCIDATHGFGGCPNRIQLVEAECINCSGDHRSLEAKTAVSFESAHCHCQHEIHGVYGCWQRAQLGGETCAYCKGSHQVS